MKNNLLQQADMSHTSIKSGYKQANTFMVSLIAFLLFSLISMNSFAQDEGKQLFEKNCQVCHKIGGGKLVGPELLGITQLREREWLVKFIRNSKELID